MENKESLGQRSRSGITGLWILGGCALSITTFCALASTVMLLGSMVLNAYLAWTLSGYDITISRARPGATAMAAFTPSSEAALLPTATPTAIPPPDTATPVPTPAPTNTPTPTPSPTSAPTNTPTPMPSPTTVATSAAPAPTAAPSSPTTTSATQSGREAEFITAAGMGAQIAETEAEGPAADASMLMGPDLLPAAGPTIPEALTYIVQPGDTLWLIAVKAYGRGSLWQVIFEANRDVLEDPSRIWPEQVLEIPPVP